MTVQDEDDDDEQLGKADGDAAARKKRPKKKKKKKDQEDGEDLQPTTTPSPSPCPAPHEGTRPDGLGCEEEAEEEQEWVDITSTCDLAVQGMHVGEMIASPHFRLFDAMSAVEIMDPKMDSGYGNSEDMTIEKAKAGGIVKTKLSHEELVTIWDQLLMYYLLWLEGHTIVQTCFCCLYLQDLKFLKTLPLFGAFVDAYLHAIRQAWNIVLKASVFDDEDFMPNMFNIDIDQACVFSAKPGEIWQRIGKEIAALKKISSESVEAIVLRLQFIGEYMLALNDAEAFPPEKNGKKSPAQQRLMTCLELVHQLGQGARPPVEDALYCFDASVNRKLLVPGPPRTVEPIKDSQKVFAMWTSHIHELLLCGELGDKTLAQLLEGAITWKDEPTILPRSIAQLHVSEESFLSKLTYESLSLFLFPEEARTHCKKPVEVFVQRVQALFAHMLKQTHSNRARRFRRLAHVFPDFNALQHEALALDEKLKNTFGANLRYPRPSWTWIMEYSLQAMLTKLFLGFQLELYDPAEYHMVYWYSDYLFGLRIYSLNELHYAKEQPIGGGPKRRPKQQAAPKGSTKPRNPPPSMYFLEAYQATVRGLFRLLAFCLRRNLVHGSPPSVAEGLAQRFVLRFRSLEHFRLPHLPSFWDFEKSSASTQAALDTRMVLEAAQASFADASHFLDKFSALRDKCEQPFRGEPCASESPAEEAKAIRKVVISNQVTIAQLMKGLAGERKMPKVTPVLQHHQYLSSVQVLPE